MDGQLTFLKTYPGLSEEMPENHESPVCEVTITNAIVSHKLAVHGFQAFLRITLGRFLGRWVVHPCCSRPKIHYLGKSRLLIISPAQKKVICRAVICYDKNNWFFLNYDFEFEFCFINWSNRFWFWTKDNFQNTNPLSI